MLRKSFILFFILFSGISFSATFTKKATVEPVLVQKGQGRYWCPVCGLNLEENYKTNYISKLPNGTPRQYCSLGCLVMDMEEYGIDKASVNAVDAKSQKIAEVKNGYFLIGSKIKATTGKTSRLFFENEKDALEFKKRYRGKIVDFETALEMTKADIKKDKEYSSKKHRKKTYPMGKKIFELKCNQDIDPTEYIEINELKENLKFGKLCQPLNEERLHAVALYLWDVKRFGDLDAINDRVKVEEDEKCPVCGMFTYKYPRWAAQIFYEEGDEKKHWSFDGVKDLIKFYFDPMKWGDYKIAKLENITKILVTDYYSQKAIDGTKAYYVIRSDVYGPMGHEFIPFASMEDAKTFKKDHFGKKIIGFQDITEDDAYKLDYNE